MLLVLTALRAGSLLGGQDGVDLLHSTNHLQAVPRLLQGRTHNALTRCVFASMRVAALSSTNITTRV